MKWVRLISLLIMIWIATIASGQRNFNMELLAEIPQGILTNDIWGYVDSSGREYAILGTREEAVIYDLSDPSDPQEVGRVSGTRSIWRDFKSFGNFVFQTTDEGTDGLTIIDMTLAPDSISSFKWTESFTVGGVTAPLRTCHNLYIDNKGVAYMAGCNRNGGVWMVDIATDPYNPTFIAAVNERYAHDVFVRDSTLYASEISNGVLGIYNISDKFKPELLSLTVTTTQFTHNAWTSDDGKYVFTTDERSNSNVDAYDITDPNEPIRIDTYNPRPGGGTIPHNVHYYNGYLVVSWYTEGIIILDAHRPGNLIRVGQYDTYPQGTSGGDGCWGAYPFLPSGLILGSDLSNGLFVFQPSYQRAAYLEGNILELESEIPINNVSIRILATDEITDRSNANGVFATGTVDTGLISVELSHPDYVKDTALISFQSGQVVDTTFFLLQRELNQLSGIVSDTSGNPIPNANIQIALTGGSFETTSDENGNYNVQSFSGIGEIRIAAWGYKGMSDDITVNRAINSDYTLELGYEDDFFADLGWQVMTDATFGSWTRAIPTGTFFEGQVSNPDQDLPDDIGEYCFVTGNNSQSVSSDDVDDGTTILRSPFIDLSNFVDPQIQVTPWFFNAGGNDAINDTLFFYIENPNESILATFITYDPNQLGWRAPLEINILDYIQNASEVQLRIDASDLPPRGHLVEAGIDRFRVIDQTQTTPTKELEFIKDLNITPNPSSDYITIDIPESTESIERYQIVDMQGRVHIVHTISASKLRIDELSQGLYLLDVWTNSNHYQGKFIKVN